MADLIIGGALTLASLAWIAAGFVFLLGLLRAAARPTPNAAAAPEVQPVPPRACSVPICDTNPCINVYASGEWWPFCLEHGLPYLTEELAR